MYLDNDTARILSKYFSRSKRIYSFEKKREKLEGLEKKSGAKKLTLKLYNFYKKNKKLQEVIQNPIILIEDEDKKKNKFPLKSFLTKSYIR